jgi:hypothetical protein
VPLTLGTRSASLSSAVPLTLGTRSIKERARAARPDGRTDLKPNTDGPSVDLFSAQNETVDSGNLHRTALNMELELASGERPRTAVPADRIIASNAKFQLPFEAVQRFLHETAGDLRARHVKPVNPALLAKCFSEEANRWVRDNQAFVEQCRGSAERTRRTAVQAELPIAEIPLAAETIAVDEAPPVGMPAGTCQSCHGAGQRGYGDNRSACGYCRGTGVYTAFARRAKRASAGDRA